MQRAILAQEKQNNQHQATVSRALGGLRDPKLELLCSLGDAYMCMSDTPSRDKVLLTEKGAITTTLKHCNMSDNLPSNLSCISA